MGAAEETWMRLRGDVVAWRDIEARYREPHRAYHTLDHVGQVLGVLARLGVTDDATLFAAILHDVVYDPRRSDNEERSAQYAAKVLAVCDDSVVARTARLILATAAHDASEGDGSCAALLDADLSILGAPDATYDRYAQAIRDEYSHVPDDAYRAGRRAVLERFAARTRLFITERMHRDLDSQARRNLRRELDRLR